MPATTVAASRRAMTLAERQPLDRHAPQMTQPVVCSAHPERGAPGLTAPHGVSQGPSTAWSLQNRPEPAEDPEYRTGMRVCSAFRLLRFLRPR